MNKIIAMATMRPQSGHVLLAVMQSIIMYGEGAPALSTRYSWMLAGHESKATVLATGLQRCMCLSKLTVVVSHRSDRQHS